MKYLLLGLMFLSSISIFAKNVQVETISGEVVEISYEVLMQSITSNSEKGVKGSAIHPSKNGTVTISNPMYKHRGQWINFTTHGYNSYILARGICSLFNFDDHIGAPEMSRFGEDGVKVYVDQTGMPEGFDPGYGNIVESVVCI